LAVDDLMVRLARQGRCTAVVLLDDARAWILGALFSDWQSGRTRLLVRMRTRGARKIAAYWKSGKSFEPLVARRWVGALYRARGPDAAQADP
jgi:hypothetical protein